MRARFLERRDLIVRLLNDVPGITCATPGGAFYAWPNVTEACRLTGCADSEAFRKRLLHEAGIAVLADIHFGRRVPGDGQHIRFSYAASNEAIEQGVGAARRFRAQGRRREADCHRSDNRASRDAILGRVRKALGTHGIGRAGARRRARRTSPRIAQGPRPAMPADLVQRFVKRATDMASTVERIASPDAIPAAVARYLDALELPPALADAEVARRRLLARVRGARLGGRGPRPSRRGRRRATTASASPARSARSPRPARSCSSPAADAPTATALLPDTHVAVVRADRIVSGMEEAFALDPRANVRRCRAPST